MNDEQILNELKKFNKDTLIKIIMDNYHLFLTEKKLKQYQLQMKINKMDSKIDQLSEKIIKCEDVSIISELYVEYCRLFKKTTNYSNELLNLYEEK